MAIEHTAVVLGCSALFGVATALDAAAGIESTTVIGTGGVGVLAWIAASVRRFLNAHEEAVAHKARLVEAITAQQQAQREHWAELAEWHRKGRARLARIHRSLDPEHAGTEHPNVSRPPRKKRKPARQTKAAAS